ncbi:RICIN domain-containing protein [Kribbella sp. NBC_01245]|uniref:RICIN domain-containing protein n=1 Tax=Kribbella sp. NBC_01245 TaxID=2903578 RepID=UPI002E28E04F|nr:RICIN domain-containing protein [Kribbella sp. NBC_01245]
MRTRLAITSVAAAALLLPSLGLTTDSAAQAAGPVGSGSVSAEPKAAQRVELDHLKSETTQVFREPSGLHTMEQYATPVRARKGPGWAPIDTKLKFQPDGSVRPGLIVTDLRLSGGGDEKLVALGKNTKQVRMAWPDRLPKPVLDGDTATYPEVFPGVDLRVRVEATGFQHVLVVKNREAAKNPALKRLRFPISGSGLKLTTKPDGTTTATDASGKALFTAGKAVMWDSPTAVQQQEPRAKHASIPTTRSAQDLVIEPDQKLLNAPATRYPVYIDPSWAVNNYLWTHVSAEYQDQSYWDYDRGEGAKVGRSYDNVITYRSFFQFGGGDIAGARVTSGTFQIWLDHSSSGSPTPTELWWTHGIDRNQPVTWRNTGGHWRAHVATASGNARTAGGQPDMLMSWTSDGLKWAAQQVADAGQSTITFGLKAPSETDISQWKRFHGHTAKIVITYNNAPNKPSRVNFTRARPCAPKEAPIVVSWPLSGYSFSAVASDKDGDNLTTRLSIHQASNDALTYELDSATTTSGSAFAWPAIDRTKLADGQTYYYYARSNDNVPDDIDFGPATERCYFTVDAKKPLGAVLESTDFPDGEAAIPARTVGTVTLRPAPGDTDVAEYLYGFKPERITSRIKAGADGTAKIPLTVWQTATGTMPAKMLYVKAVDAANNVSDEPTVWQLSANKLTQLPAKRRGDVNGDGRADLSAVLDQGDGRTAIWNIVAKDGGLQTGQLAWDSGANGGFAMYRTRPVRGDFDGDGRTDAVLVREEAGRRIGMYRGLSDSERYNFESAPVWHSGANGWPLSTARIVAGDVNGDGKSDIVAQLNVAGTSWRTLTFLGPTLNAPTEWLQTTSPWSGSAPLLADVDGDKNADLVDMQNVGGCHTVTRYFKSSGTAFSPTPTVLHDSGAGAYCWERSKPQVADVDGDGKDDIVTLYENSGTDASLKVFKSTGSAYTLSEWWRDTTTFDPARTALATGDFSADGKEDVGLIYSLDGGGREAYTLTSTGTSFGPAASGWREPRVGASTGPSFDIENRTYELVSRNTGKCLDVWNNNQADGERLVQHTCHGGLNQRFRIKQIAGIDQFEIQTAHFQGNINDGRPRCLDVYNQLHGDEVGVLQWPCMGTSNQQLRIEYLEGSSYDTVVRLKFAHSDKCASPAEGSTGEAVSIVQRTCAAEASQQWILRAGFNPGQPDGQFRVRAVHGGMTLDVANCGPDAEMRMWEWVPGSPCQRWQFLPLGDDVYKIIEPSTAQAVDVLGCTDALALQVATMPENEGSCQRWRVEPAFDGTWSITQESNGNSLDVAGCNPAAGAGLITWRYWNGPCQRWWLDQP